MGFFKEFSCIPVSKVKDGSGKSNRIIKYIQAFPYVVLGRPHEDTQPILPNVSPDFYFLQFEYSSVRQWRPRTA